LPRLGGEGEIIVSQRVVAAIESVFESENVGDLALKRHARPVTAYRFVALRVLACPAVD
jgi:class 3 adenylate cyclase